MKFERARTDEQILNRKKEIINTAADLYDKEGIDGVHFKAIGEITSFSRSTIYKYYSTKEEILLDLLIVDLKEWIKYINSMVSEYSEISKETYCRKLTDSYINNIRMLKLMSILFSVLEKNSTVEKLAFFKKELMAQIAPLALSLDKYFPKSSDETKQTFIYSSMCFVLGLFPATHMTQKQIEAIKLSGIKHKELNFSELCYNGLLQLMADL